MIYKVGEDHMSQHSWNIAWKGNWKLVQWSRRRRRSKLPLHVYQIRAATVIRLLCLDTKWTSIPVWD